MRIAKFDAETYIRMQGSASGTVYKIGAEDLADIEMVEDQGGELTRGSVIGYAVAYALMAGFVGAMFYFL